MIQDSYSLGGYKGDIGGIQGGKRRDTRRTEEVVTRRMQLRDNGYTAGIQ